eukprot:gene1773-biopygen5803
MASRHNPTPEFDSFGLASQLHPGRDEELYHIRVPHSAAGLDSISIASIFFCILLPFIMIMLHCSSQHCRYRGHSSRRLHDDGRGNDDRNDDIDNSVGDHFSHYLHLLHPFPQSPGYNQRILF